MVAAREPPKGLYLLDFFSVLGIAALTLQGCNHEGAELTYADLQCEQAVDNAINRIAKRGDMLLSMACNVDIGRMQQIILTDNVEDISSRCYSSGASNIEGSKVEYKAQLLSKCKEALAGREVSDTEIERIVGSTLLSDKETTIMAAMEKDQFAGIQKAKKQANEVLGQQMKVQSAVPTAPVSTLPPVTSAGNLFSTAQPHPTCPVGQCWCVSNGGKSCSWPKGGECDPAECFDKTKCPGNGYWCANETSALPDLTTKPMPVAATTTTNFIDVAESRGMVTRYLPEVLDGHVVLQKISDFKYVANNSLLESVRPGLGYRVSKHIEDMDPDHLYIGWGHTVVGLDDGGGWVKCEVEKPGSSSQAATTAVPSLNDAGVAVVAAAKQVMAAADEWAASTTPQASQAAETSSAESNIVIGQVVTTAQPEGNSGEMHRLTEQPTGMPTAMPTADTSLEHLEQETDGTPSPTENLFAGQDQEQNGSDSEESISIGDAVTIGLCLCGGMLAGGAMVFGAAHIVRQRKTTQERSLVPRSENEAGGAALEGKAGSPTSTLPPNRTSPQGMSPKHSAHEDAWKKSLN